jgi:long-chain acyl-CoA synthetase
MSGTTPYTMPALIGAAVRRFGDRDALAFVGGTPETYVRLAAGIDAVSALLQRAGIGRGDRVAILGHNMPNWAKAYFGATFTGAVAVPLLPDFHPSEIDNILRHAEPAALFVSAGLEVRLKEVDAAPVRLVVRLDDFQVIRADEPGLAFDPKARPQAPVPEVAEDDLAAIIYTSGTTGNSKGVMLTHRNICHNASASRLIQPVNEHDRFLSILPLSHTYENTLGLILPLISGASVHYLQKPPTPAVLLPALASVRPTTILAVPLVIEKIYRHRVLPVLTKNAVMRLLYRIPFLRRGLHRIAGRKLMETFGGRLRFFGVGGAKLDPIVDRFLDEARFPYAIGYGLTETSPLAAGSAPFGTKVGFVGPRLPGTEVELRDVDPRTGEGEIWIKGPNVMRGYYREPDLTAEVLTVDGWFRTGDLGFFDADGNLAIRGRLKNVIVGASGENIYPEEIESVINSFRHVVESLVVQQKGRLVAMVHLNRDELEQRYHHLRDEAGRRVDDVERRADEVLRELKAYVNARVNRFSQIQVLIHSPEPFIKTATQKIKRFIYQERKP